MRRSTNLQRLFLLGLSGPILALNVWILSQVFRYFEHSITLLVVAAILAFLLNYPVQFLERAQITRSQAVIVVLLLALALLVVLGVTLVPVLVEQAAQFVDKLPASLAASQRHLASLDVWAKAHRLPLDLQGFSTRINNQIENQLQTLVSQALGVALVTVSGLFDLVLVVVLAFYMLLYGDRMWQGLVHLLPPSIGLPLSVSLRLNFQNFFISQMLLGLFMFAILTPIFMGLRVPFALLFALLIGIAELIPFIGATLGIGLVILLVMFQNFWLSLQVAFVAILMQQIKDNVFAPRLMGNFTGLNPIWIFIAILMGAQIAGLLGVVVAVPIAGTIKSTIDAIREMNRPKVVTTEVLPGEKPAHY
ncbi:MAG: AI-2E family transporter [Trichocoleus desertorum ATA4-8-CV12]|nr:AI-2E family transporter [Trichocoleus desertorum ATA4-8-CV12]